MHVCDIQYIATCMSCDIQYIVTCMSCDVQYIAMATGPTHRLHTDDLCNGKAKSGSNSNLLIGQIPHIDHVTGFLQLQRSCIIIQTLPD